MSATEFAAPQASRLTKDSVQRLAESVAKQLGFEPGGDLEALVKKLGGRILYKDFFGGSESDSGSMEVRSEGDFDIFLARQTSRERDRFTIAHELGHYVLHYLWAKRKEKEIGALRASRYGSDRAEWEANWFAASFLMPETAFREHFEAANKDVTVVADLFGVSVMAARIRAQALNLLPQ